MSVSCTGGIRLPARPVTSPMWAGCRDGEAKVAILKHKIETDQRWSPHARAAIKREDCADWKIRSAGILCSIATLMLFALIMWIFNPVEPGTTFP